MQETFEKNVWFFFLDTKILLLSKLWTSWVIIYTLRFWLFITHKWWFNQHMIILYCKFQKFSMRISNSRTYDFLLKSITVMLITVNNGKGEEKILILELVNSVVNFLHFVTTTFWVNLSLAIKIPLLLSLIVKLTVVHSIYRYIYWNSKLLVPLFCFSELV